MFARFREQACIIACPYGRVLSSLVDERTITVTYDAARGEPRTRLVARPRAVQAAADSRPAGGDCIDCFRCVTVCPTGIDIRNGIQMECVACTACIDACNDVMTRVSRPTGLIRHASAHALQHGAARRFSPRIAAYAAVWLMLVGTGVFLLATRPDLDVVILRQPGTLYATLAGGEVANFYTVEALLKSRNASIASFTLYVVGEGIEKKVTDFAAEVAAQAAAAKK